MPTACRVVLKPRRARPFFARHPWVYGESIATAQGSPGPGDEVDVFSHEGAFIARGLYNPASRLRVRLYRWHQMPLDSGFWLDKLESALRLRTTTLGLGATGTAYRLVFSEGDGLSGLTVDRFDEWLVAHFSSLALHRRRELLLNHLLALTGAKGAIARPERGIAEEEGLSRGDVHIVGTLPPQPVAIVENDLEYLVDLQSGQKSGFYCDQRENRRRVAEYCEGKRVLDLFCYTGGFSLNALKHGRADSTLGTDSSAPALALAQRNADGNGLHGARFERGDVLKTLERLKSQGVCFDVVICDPPKYARHARDMDVALKGYRRLNLAAVGVLAAGGILVTCSCSGLIDRPTFAMMLGEVAAESGRPIQILEERGQPPDHPISAACLEGDYLKCFLCAVGS